MDTAREVALKLAQDAEPHASPQDVVKRAEVYLEFLRKTDRPKGLFEELQVEMIRPASGLWLSE